MARFEEEEEKEDVERKGKDEGKEEARLWKRRQRTNRHRRREKEKEKEKGNNKRANVKEKNVFDYEEEGGDVIEQSGNHSECLSDDKATSFACKRMKRWQKNGELLVSLTNLGNLDMWRNWAASAQLSGVTNFVTFSLDFESMSPPPGAEGLFAHLAPLPLHLRKKLHLSSDGNLETFHEFKTSMYNSFMKLVPELILWVVSLEYSVLYSDTDVVLLSDPFVVTRDLARDYDWLMSLDSYDARGKDPCQYIIACGGILYAKHSPFAMSILQDWARSVYNTTYLKKGNQRAYNDVLVKHNISKMGILPCSMFPNGGRFNEVHGGVTWRKSQKVSPVMVHNNWIIGKNNKIETFKRWGLWIEDLEDPSLPITPKMDEKLERITSKMSITERFTFKKS